MLPPETAGVLDSLNSLPKPGSLIILSVIFGLGPSLALILTSFLKISVVMLILRQALGLQNIPSNIAVNGLALILSFYVMAPVGYAMFDRLQANGVDLNEISKVETRDAMVDSVEPMRVFLNKHSSPMQKEFFFLHAQRMIGDLRNTQIIHNDFVVLIPAFTVSQLKSAFEIGFLLYLPFIVIDLIVSNILLSLGMMMVSPMTVSLPFKLLLFVSIDGWTRLIESLILSFV